jgi:RHS repeat-associated protein
LNFFLYGQAGQLWYQEYAAKSLAVENVYLAGSLVATREFDWDAGTFTSKYHHTDALGSPVAVTNTAGQVTERTDWEPYGAAIGKPSYEGIGFTGHVQDAATGLTYMQQRYYDPMIGRFLSVDPVTADSKTGGNFNRYWYANNNPYKFTDPDGRQSLENVKVPSTGVPFLDRLMNPSDAAGSQRQMMEKQFAFELSQPQSARDVVLGVAVALSAGTGAAGGGTRTLVSAEGASTAISITSGATRASPMQIRVSMTAGEARTNLAGNGFKWKGSETTPGAGTMTKGNVTYKFSPTSNSTGLPSATVVVDGKRTAKLRFDEK